MTFSTSLADHNYKTIKNVSFVGTAEDIDITQFDWFDSIIRGSTTTSVMDQDQLDSRQVGRYKTVQTIR